MSTPRPRSVTLGCVYGGLGGLLSTILLFEVLQGWGSLEMQEAIDASLTQLGADVGVDALLPTLRWVVMGLLVASIAATVFAFYAARGHQASRIGLSLLSGFAAVTFVLSGVAGLLPALLAGLVVYLLWSAPAREWFAVVNGRTPVSLGAAPTVRPGPGPTAPPGPGTAPGTVAPPPYDPVQHAHHVVAPARPRPVTLALSVAGIGSALGTAACGLVLAALVLFRDDVVRQYGENDMLARQVENAGMTPAQLVDVGTWLFAAWFAVSVLGLLATLWALGRRPAARWALLAVSVLTAGVAVLGVPIGLLWLVGSIVVIVQLMRPEAKEWFGRA